ncbi:Flp pilus assembly protein CpaB [Phycobacter azelaicus]|jgi:pilus assembly protein CpaB|uniref:Flp pilus assembly protein CpaB n=1 Tax=Phycobacter azelaicus TaxID=2668075 RepID=UPI001865D0C7|nr:Flp pilus assembly protein CpaB [Phycobacter azelaicus]MBE1296274.1 Flp pilus assembly protein CpaB [Paracoccaceae bacterium]
MRAVFGLVLIVGVALAGGAVMMAKNYISAYQNELARERANRAEVVPTTDVYVATKQLKYGERLTEEAVRKVRWPEESVPEGAFTSLEELFPPERSDEPRVVLRTMEKDEPLLTVKVSAPGEDAGITSRLARGMRAFAIKVDVASGVSGFLRPGDRVDVYWTGAVRGANVAVQGDVTRLIETNVELIAVDQSAGGDIDGAVIARTVTVAARPEQVAALAQAQSTGKLSLALVGAEDDTVAAMVEVDQRKLLGLSAVEAPVVAQEERVCTIRTRRGAEVVEIPIPCSN